jgi:single-stranded-DNA-specific exonuclease
MSRPAARVRPHDAAAAELLARALDVPQAAGRVLAARGFFDTASARAYLNPAPEALHDPFGMSGLPDAVARLGAVAKRGGRVVVFGDYDCDGISALAILTTVLKRLGADAIPFIPHRIQDGYGLKRATLLKVIDEHAPEAIVTVDCGITAVEPIAEAVARGVSMVVTDHHLPPSALPEGAVLVDPKIPGCPYPFKELCGAGIAWKLAQALLENFGEGAGLDEATQRRWSASLAKIAAIATIADVVPLVGENRILAAWGLSGLANPRAPGLTALLRRAGIPQGSAPSARDVAFRIAPRLNAAGRIDHAARSLELLTTGDAARAEELADRIERDNEERRGVQERVVAAVLERLASTFDAARDAVIVECGGPDDGWHRGVLGIAASRVAERVKRPVLLLSRDGEIVAGSGRTWGRTPLHDRLAPVARRFAKDFGGHEAALGISLPASSYDAFREEARRAFSDARDEAEWAEELVADTELDAVEATPDLAKTVGRFEPHGRENERPLFLLSRMEWDGNAQPVGERGLKLILGGGGRRLDTIGWSLAGRLATGTPSALDVVASFGIDGWTGRPSLTVLDAVVSA